MSESDKDLEAISRWLDDELSEDEARDVERRMAMDEGLRKDGEGLRAADAAFRRHAKSELSSPATIDATLTIRRGFANRRKKSARREQLIRWMPLAASLAIAVGAAIWVERIVSGNAEDRRVEIAGLVESAVQNALETALSGSEVVVDRGLGGADLRIVPIRTYRSETDHWCREFTEQFVADGTVIKRDSVACREPNGGWRRVTDTGT